LFLILPLHQIQLQINNIAPAMASKFVENLEEVPITHPHLNVSLDDILAEEGRKRSSSQSSESSNSNGRSGSETAQSPTSPTHPEGHLGSIKRRAFALGSKKIRRAS
jgi:lariat debranching enzyme